MRPIVIASRLGLLMHEYDRVTPLVFNVNKRQNRTAISDTYMLTYNCRFGLIKLSCDAELFFKHFPRANFYNGKQVSFIENENGFLTSIDYYPLSQSDKDELMRTFKELAPIYRRD